MDNEIKKLEGNMNKIQRDIELIKNILMSEGELSSWAKKELAKARKRPESSYISLEDYKHNLMTKK